MNNKDAEICRKSGVENRILLCFVRDSQPVKKMSVFRFMN